MFLIIEYEVDITCQIFVCRKAIILAHIVRLGHRLPDMLHAEGQGVLQLVDNLVRHTLARHPYGKGKGELGNLAPLYGQVVGVGKPTLVAEDLIADK